MAKSTAGSGAGQALMVELLFDLDLALTPSPYNPAAAASSPDHLVASMPTAPGTAVCAVCMEGCEAGKQTPCGHVFHGTCISSWLWLHNSCPICRRRILSDG